MNLNPVTAELKLPSVPVAAVGAHLSVSPATPFPNICGLSLPTSFSAHSEILAKSITKKMKMTILTLFMTVICQTHTTYETFMHYITEFQG